MKPEKDNIKDIFSSKLKGFEPDLPISMWEKIDADLSAQQPMYAAPKIPAKKINIYKYAAWIASAAAIIAIALLIFYPQNTPREALAINTETRTETIDLTPLKENALKNIKEKEERERERKEDAGNNSNRQIQVQPHNNLSLTQSTRNFIASLGSTTYPSDKAKEQKQDTQIAESNDKLPALVSDENDKPQSPEKPDNISVSADTDTSQGKIYVAENTETPDRTSQRREVSEEELAEKIAALVAESRKGEELLADNYVPENKTKKKKDEDSSSKGFQLGAGGSGTFSKGKGEQIQLRKVNYLYSDMANNKEDAPNYNSAITQETNLYQRQEMKMEHNQPITFGVSVSKKISNRVSLETGIVYTYASSKYVSDDNSDLEAYDSQYFHYLGLPLSINYKIFEWNKLQVYLSAGGLIQKDIYGRIRTSQNVPSSENARESESKTISQDHPQFSLNSSLGISYPLYKKLSAYTNIGAAYYIDANNQYETIYSDRRWLFNLNLGVRFNF